MQFTLFAEFVLSIEGSKLCLKMLLFSLVTHMSCQLDVIGCTEESPIFDGMYEGHNVSLSITKFEQKSIKIAPKSNRTKPMNSS